MSFVVLVESSRLKECVAYLFSFHISKNQKNTLFKGAKVPSPLNMIIYLSYGDENHCKLVKCTCASSEIMSFQ